MINRILRHALLLGVVFACIAARPSALSAQLRHGDVSGEGVVSALDAQAILSRVVGLGLPGNFMPANGVVDCASGRTDPTALDAQIVLMYVIGLNVSSYCVGQTFGPGATTVALTPLDSSVLIGKTRVFKAILRQADNQQVARPVTWTSSAPSVAVVDSVKNDSLAYVRGVAQGSATITAFSDGTSHGTPLQVVNSYAGVVITPQRGDTLNQIGIQATFYAQDRDSVGNFGVNRPSFWTAADTNIIAVRNPAATTSQYYSYVEARGTGTTWLYATSQLNPAYKDSVPVTVQLPSVNSCIAGTGTLHPSYASYTTPQTWTAATNPHFIGYNVSFAAGANLTIEPGVLVCAQSGASIQLHNGARLTALGTVANPIRFTTDDPSTVWTGIQLGDYTS
ncbi:MAG TPA: Ig-like domain-containing protein, partial [Gemmatimonadaceae bacterium]|nr:Ig-like domain-containing protein [Gemmatimonadaceae bacterium]